MTLEENNLFFHCSFKAFCGVLFSTALNPGDIPWKEYGECLTCPLELHYILQAICFLTPIVERQALTLYKPISLLELYFCSSVIFLLGSFVPKTREQLCLLKGSAPSFKQGGAALNVGRCMSLGGN